MCTQWFLPSSPAWLLAIQVYRPASSTCFKTYWYNSKPQTNVNPSITNKLNTFIWMSTRLKAPELCWFWAAAHLSLLLPCCPVVDAHLSASWGLDGEDQSRYTPAPAHCPLQPAACQGMKSQISWGALWENTFSVYVVLISDLNIYIRYYAFIEVLHFPKKLCILWQTYCVPSTNFPFSQALI